MTKSDNLIILTRLIKLTNKTRSIILTLYKHEKSPYRLLNNLYKYYMSVKPHMFKLRQYYEMDESEFMMNREMFELGETLLLDSPNVYLENTNCLDSLYKKLMTTDELNTYSLLFKFQDRVYKTMQNRDSCKYITTLFRLDYALSTIHPYKDSSEFNNV